MQRHQNTGLDSLTQDIGMLGWCPMVSVILHGEKVSLALPYGVDVLLRQSASHSSSPTGLVTTESEALNRLRLT